MLRSNGSPLVGGTAPAPKAATTSSAAELGVELSGSSALVHAAASAGRASTVALAVTTETGRAVTSRGATSAAVAHGGASKRAVGLLEGSRHNLRRQGKVLPQVLNSGVCQVPEMKQEYIVAGSQGKEQLQA